MAKKRIVVVGAGIAGLTAAYQLARRAREEARDLELTILEAEAVPGGQARAFTIDGMTVEHGSHVFFNYYDTILRLIDELRSDPAIGPSMPGLARVPGWTIVDAYGHRATLRQAPHLPAPLSVLPSMMRIPWLGIGDRLRAARAAYRVAKLPFDRFAEYDQKTAYELGLEMGYPELGVLAWSSASLGLTNLFVTEQSGAIFAGKHKVLLGTPDGLSYQLTAGDLSDLFANPMRRKLDALGVRTRFGAHVTELGRGEGATTTRVAFSHEGSAQALEADYVVLALRPGDAAPLVPWVDAPWKELRPVTPVITMVLRLSGRVRASADERELGLNREQWAFSVVTDLSRFWPDLAGDKTVLRCEIGHADRLPSGVETSDAEIVRMVKLDLERLYPEVAAMAVEQSAIHRESKHLYVRWVRGTWAKKPKARDVGRGVFLAGDWTSRGTIGMEAAANSGVEAANHVLVREGMAPIPYRDVPI